MPLRIAEPSSEVWNRGMARSSRRPARRVCSAGTTLEDDHIEEHPGKRATKAPILIVQGDADTIVAPDVTERLVQRLCQNGETVRLRLAPGVGHLETGHEAAPAVLQWIDDRFAGKPRPTSCT